MDNATEQPPQSVERRGRVAKIEKPEGTYSVIYGTHRFKQPVEDLPSGFLSGVFLEAVGDYIGHTHELMERSKTAKAQVDTAYQYQDVIKHCEERKIPLFFSDISVYDGIKPTDVSNAITAAEVTAGVLLGALLGSKLVKDAQQKKFPRRNLLQIAGVGWLVFNPLFVGTAGRALSQITGKGEEITAKINNMTEKVHPEVSIFLSVFRDALIAYKEEKLMLDMKTHPSFATILGAGHTGIESLIQASIEEKFNFIRDAWNLLMHRFVKPEYLYTVIKSTYNGSEWLEEAIEIPELKDLVNKDKTADSVN